MLYMGYSYLQLHDLKCADRACDKYHVAQRTVVAKHLLCVVKDRAHLFVTLPLEQLAEPVYFGIALVGVAGCFLPLSRECIH